MVTGLERVLSEDFAVAVVEALPLGVSRASVCPSTTPLMLVSPRPSRLPFT
jgi:hypothetical protein